MAGSKKYQRELAKVLAEIAEGEAEELRRVEQRRADDDRIIREALTDIERRK